MKKLVNQLTIFNCLYVFGSLHVVLADDVEIFKSPETGEPNILFILDSSNSTLRTPDGDKTNNHSKSRLGIVQSVLSKILYELKDVRVGLMSFDTHKKGGFVVHPVAPI